MACLASRPLFPSPDLSSLDPALRRAYLHRLWHADVDPMLFLDAARRLGYGVQCRWDYAAGMPVLALLH
jgi:hypothetical protein